MNREKENQGFKMVTRSTTAVGIVVFRYYRAASDGSSLEAGLRGRPREIQKVPVFKKGKPIMCTRVKYFFIGMLVASFMWALHWVDIMSEFPTGGVTLELPCKHHLLFMSEAPEGMTNNTNFGHKIWALKPEKISCPDGFSTGPGDCYQHNIIYQVTKYIEMKQFARDNTTKTTVHNQFRQQIYRISIYKCEGEVDQEQQTKYSTYIWINLWNRETKEEIHPPMREVELTKRIDTGITSGDIY